MKKKFIVLISVLIIAIAALFVFLPEKLEEVVASELKEQGQRVFGTEVTVSEVDIDIKQGTATISEISVANPPNYSSKSAITLASIVAKFNYRDAVIDEIIISSPQVNAEFNDKNLNILDLANHAESVRRNTIPAAGQNPAPAEPVETESKEEAEDPPLILTIKRVALEQPQVTINSAVSDSQKTFTIDRLEARDLKGNSHQLADQLVRGLFNDLSRQVIARSALSLGEDALETLKDKAREKLKNLLN